MPLVRERVVSQTDAFILPENGMTDVRLWIRSAALYLKMAKLDRESPGAFLSNPMEALLLDLEERAELKRREEGEAVTTGDGRDALADSITVLYDAWLYLEQDREERCE